ncbi:unnamed protein product [Parascedosporium putredinis]|uniref:USP domain-containing protein n=1 Tax=Parascedosporium putredinis TaxID=1442378 RepID=A0A9P1HAG5_9PEZI|nr:unnamed protein product [Parascedosporium putredinis]CAI8002608.1 unnamed protein product [Parascedosporium putredinis]
MSSNPNGPAEPGSSCVTINLRNANFTSSASASPSMQALQEPPLADDVKLSVELPDREMNSNASKRDVDLDAVTSPIPATPVTSLSDSGSPDIEVIDIPTDDPDPMIGDGEPEVSIIGEGGDALQDPTLEFPYNEGEPLAETVSRLANYISSQHPLEEGLFESLQSWADLFIRWAETAGYQVAYESCSENSGLWQSFPDLAWAACNRALNRTTLPRQAISSFYLIFARLTAFFVALDCQTLAGVANQSGNLDDGRPRILTNLDSQSGWLRPDLISELVQGFQAMPGGTIQALTRLVDFQIRLMERYPRLVDQPAAVCQVVSDLAWESNRRLHFAGQSQPAIDQSKQRLVQSHRFYLIVSKSLSDTIERLVNHLSTDGASGQIISLTDIYHCALYGEHKMATDILSAHAQNHPNLPAHLAPGAIAWEWRFNMFGKLIMSSQMQLRVWAVGHMCSDLVMFWRRCGDGQEDLAAFLAYFAEYLMRTKLVEYILGPTCHPEITIESGNVVGFLLVTKFYQKEQTDLLWQTITSCQDRRVADALTRMAANITHLCDQEHLLYFCEKLQLLPIDSFNTASIRHFCEQIFKQLMSKTQGERQLLNFLPTSFAYGFFGTFAAQKLRELHHHGPDRDGRRRLYLTCIEDIAAKSPTTLGSLSGLFISIRHALGLELQVLTAEHNLSGLLINELEHAISLCTPTNGLYVLTGASNSPRRDFIYSLICHEPGSLTAELGKRLWDMMVGPDSPSAEDRASGWHILNDAAAQAGFDSLFMSHCLSVHFPTLPANCFSEGALRFLKDEIVPRLNSGMITLDSQESVKESGIEELWRMTLTAPDETVSDAAIDVLVKDIYIESRAILDYPHHRARQVHLALVNRCLDQLSGAAKKLTSFSDGTGSGDEESMVIVASDEQVLEQERMFIRSLAVLRQFLQAHQSKAHFAAADLRPLMPLSPTMVVGESAELKFQSFDGVKQTDVQPLNIGRQNTAASLLASLREATGFQNYRIYYKGQVFVPTETEVCKSLEDLRIHDGLILVKREEDGGPPSSRLRPGVSPLEIAILSHFEELWGYLSLEEKFAQEIYQFIVKLPADSHRLEVLDSNSTSYLEVFPLGQPFKCLYALYALVEYTDAARRRNNIALPSFEGDGSSNGYKEAMERALKLTFAAISDPNVIERCPSGHLKSQLSLQLMTCLVDLLTTWQISVSNKETDWEESTPPLDRLLAILREAHSNPNDEHSLRLIPATFTAILLLCVVRAGCWDELVKTDEFGTLTQELLLDPRFAIREKVSKVVKEACRDEHRERLYNVIFELVKRDGEQFKWLLDDLKQLVPYDKDEDDPYHYDLPLQFERTKAIQAFASMQESIRRFVDPYLVVNSIKTYDDTLIDIHNQMDVDEFYNLLFDRWEFQLPNSDDKKILRSFYGGELVQQVKSKECEHVSERLEPFSAIQCDIKGKGTLQDSLQAYVGGEIMEGDNKYKCSTCDKHVDAVKRACLKDIPDNLIFHLKRFDFNLRTMQRSKINDYFSFPTKIDMRPYTIDYLSDPDTPGPEDIFELVGILVHSGTAESGHYYSYIRERPSSGSAETWIEFNDDLVSPWDPETMEASTFGGPDFRYDNNGIVYDKNYSAYMLFYQRSNTLRTDEETMSVPLKVDIPAEILDHIRNENTYILRRHCLFDPNHAVFVRRIFEHCVVHSGACSQEHKAEKAAMHAALGHLDQVVSRTKDIPDFVDYYDMLAKAVKDCPSCALGLFRYFRDRHESFRMLVQRNPEQLVRADSGELLMLAVATIKRRLPGVYGVVEDALGQDDADGWVHTQDVVVAQVPTSLTRSELETVVLLNNDLLSRLFRVIQADSSIDLPPNYQRMMTNLLRRGLNRPPNYENLIALADHLMSVLQPILGPDSIVEKADTRLLMYCHGETSPAWTSTEVLTAHQEWATNPGSSIFVSKLLEINQSLQATDNIMQRLVQANRQLALKVFQTLRGNITGQMLQGHSNAPYLRAAIACCKASDDDDTVLRMLTHVIAQCRQLNNTEGRAFLEFFQKMYGAPAPGSSVSPWSIFFSMTAQIPKWTPYLLGYYDGEVRWQTDEFLQRAIFDYGVAPVFEPEAGGERRKEVLISAARELGLNALFYLRDHFIQRRVHVAKDMVFPLQRVVAKASAYFNLEPDEPGPDQEFAQMSQTILDALKRITVDELEEDGSEWDNSCGSSGGDMETFETLADADLQ